MEKTRGPNTILDSNVLTRLRVSRSSPPTFAPLQRSVTKDGQMIHTFLISSCVLTTDDPATYTPLHAGGHAIVSFINTKLSGEPLELDTIALIDEGVKRYNSWMRADEDRKGWEEFERSDWLHIDDDKEEDSDGEEVRDTAIPSKDFRQKVGEALLERHDYRPHCFDEEMFENLTNDELLYLLEKNLISIDDVDHIVIERVGALVAQGSTRPMDWRLIKIFLTRIPYHVAPELADKAKPAICSAVCELNKVPESRSRGKGKCLPPDFQGKRMYSQGLALHFFDWFKRLQRRH